MNLKEQLEARLSKRQMLQLAQLVSDRPKQYDELIRLIVQGDPPVPQYGAWVLQHSAEIDSSLIIPHIGTLVDLINHDVHDGVKRAVLRSLSLIDVPAQHIDQVVDIGFRLLEDPKEPTGVKMFSMVVLWNTCQDEPFLLEELGRQIEIQMPIATAGFKSRGRKILAALAGR